jgi:hypothetical protein
MIRSILAFCVLIVITACNNKVKTMDANPRVPSGSATTAVATKKLLPKMTFDKDFIDFGIVKKGEKRTHVYKFTNTGNADLIIDLITACDCTTLTYDSSKPYKPGEGGEIKAVFDSSEKEESETIDIDVILQNEDENGYPLIERVRYRFDIEK